MMDLFLLIMLAMKAMKQNKLAVNVVKEGRDQSTTIVLLLDKMVVVQNLESLLHFKMKANVVLGREIMTRGVTLNSVKAQIVTISMTF